MKRKWNRISDSYKPKTYLIDNKELIIKLRKDGETFESICKILGFKSRGSMSNFFNKIS